MILGNLLKEKESNLPVIIVEKKKIDKLEVEIDKTHIIPFSSLGNDNGILIGFKPDYIKVITDEDNFEKKAIVGIYNGNLCGDSGDYNAIIGSI